MNPASSPQNRPRSQGMAVSKKVIDDPMAPDIDDIRADEFDAADDIFDQPFEHHPAAERTLESNRALHAAVDTPVAEAMEPSASGGSGLGVLLSPLAWLTDKLMSSDARVRLSGSAKALYSLTVRAVMGARAQMESYSPPSKGEFSHKLSLKWGILRPNLMLRGQFFIVPSQGLAGRGGEYAIGLRARLPLLPVLPWIVVAAVPAIVPVLINLIIGFSWHGPALAAGWVALTGLPLLLSYIATSRKATRQFAANIMAGLTEEALLTSQNDRSSMVALVPARPVMADQEDERDEIMPVIPRQAVVQKPAPVPVAAAKPIIPAEPVAALLKPLMAKPAEPKKAMTMDAQALVKAQMAAQVQAQLEAQLTALDKAEIELQVAPQPAKPQATEIAAPVRPAVEAPAPVASTVSSARVRSRIKKFRTRYDVASKPEKPATPAEAPATAETPQVGATLARKAKV